MIDQQKLSDVFQKASLNLIRSRGAQFILLFMFEEYRNKERSSISESEVCNNLADRLYQGDVSSIEEYGINPLDDYESKAKALLKKWLELGFLKNYPNESGVVYYELTSNSVKVLDWLESTYKKREFVGTESRLKDIFDKLHQVIEFSDPDVDKRLKDLEEQKRQIDDKILEVKLTKRVEVFDDYQIVSRLNDITQSARELLSDFKEVEENFKSITRNIYQRHTDPLQSKGKILAYTFDALSELKDSDQGKSFYAFWDFLIAKSRQDEWKEVIEQLFQLLDKRKISFEDGFLKRMKIQLHRNGQKVYEANDRMAEKLSRVIAEKELSERLKVKQLINQIKEMALKLASKGVTPEHFLSVEGRCLVRLPMERIISLEQTEVPEFEVRLDTAPLEVDDLHDLAKVFSSIFINKEILEQNISNALNKKPVVSLKELVDEYPITKGLPEVFAYFSISQGGKFRSSFNENKSEDILFDIASEKILRIPQIIYSK